MNIEKALKFAGAVILVFVVYRVVVKGFLPTSFQAIIGI